eukprot:scpid97546/ scgid4664/ 
MDDVRLPKQLLFGTLPSRRPAHGPRRRWKDCAVKDLRSRDLEADWYRVACDSRPDWRLAYTSDAPDPLVPAPVTCFTCARHFARQGDLARHKCTAERQKPVSEQRGACQCPRCHRWFRSRGGLWVCIVAPLLPRAQYRPNQLLLSPVTLPLGGAAMLIVAPAIDATAIAVQ